jgi:serine O-acetyltransferase
MQEGVWQCREIWNLIKIAVSCLTKTRQAMNLRQFLFLVRSDLYRYHGRVTFSVFLKNLLFTPGFKYSFWMRVVAYFSQHPWLRRSLYRIPYFVLMHCTYKYGISIPHNTAVGPGLYLGHFGGIVVHEKSAIGRNCNISHGVTLGQANRGRMKGHPTIGDNVYIGPGAKIVGRVSVGNNVAIGANCVVTHDVPDNAVVVGVPGKVISLDGSQDYVDFTDY